MTPNHDRHVPVAAVVNLSKRHLNQTEEAVLNKGLGFAVTNQRIPYLDLIAPLEKVTPLLPKIQAEELRWKFKQVLEKAVPPQIKYHP